MATEPVSLNGSPAVSPTIEAARSPVSTTFLALAQALPSPGSASTDQEETHFMMCVATATSSPFWLVTTTLDIERRLTTSVSLTV